MATQSTEPASQKPSMRQSKSNSKKLARLPKTHKISKRPLLRPPLASPYAGASTPKVIYITTKTPFIAAVKRIDKLLSEIEKRDSQAALAKASRKGTDSIPAAVSAAVAAAEERKNGKEGEEVTVKGTGKAISKVMDLGMFFKGREGVRVRLGTASVAAVDDVVERPVRKKTESDKEEGDETEVDGEEVPDSRVRMVSVLEVAIALR